MKSGPQSVLIKCIIAVTLIILLGCAGTQTEPQMPTYSELTDDMLQFKKPVHNSSLMPSSNSSSAYHEFSGGIELSSVKMKTKPKIKSPKEIAKDPNIFPGVTLHFFSHKGDLVPVTQDVIIPNAKDANNSYWSLLVQPGRIWSEPEDNGWSRASFPFALTSIHENETHNGIGLFLFNESEVSDMYFQIVTQTTPWLIPQHFIAWGRIPAQYDRAPIENVTELIKYYELEKRNQLPTAEWSELEDKVGKNKLARFEGNMTKSQKITSAIVYENTLYYKPTKTKYGDFPYMRNMRYGIWSVTKSVGPGIGMLRLAQKYGPQVYDLKIKDYVDIQTDHNGWDKVTFGNALSMATGIGDITNTGSGDFYTDYGSVSPDYRNFFLKSVSEQEKLDVISKSGNYPWGPGEVARYRDRDMFILGSAMNNFLKLKEGENADIWKMIAEEVFKPIQIYHAPVLRTTEPDGSLGLPLMAYGWYPTLDDLGKVADLLHRKGNFRGQQILHMEKTKELFFIQGALGQKINRKYGELKYKGAFHYLPFSHKSGKLIHLPFMLGWQGNLIVLMPGNITGIKISNGYPFTPNTTPTDPTPMANVGNKLKPFHPWDE